MKYALRKAQSFIINLSNVIFLFSGKRNDKTLYTEILCILLPILNKNQKSDF